MTFLNNNSYGQVPWLEQHMMPKEPRPLENKISPHLISVFLPGLQDKQMYLFQL